MPAPPRVDQGQALPLFAIALTAIVLASALVVDGGYAFAQRRLSQNAADLAAVAGARIVGVAHTQRPWGAGTAYNVEQAVRSVLGANDAQLIDAHYVDEDGTTLLSVIGASSIPSDAFGVVVDARVDWQPFLLGTLGIAEWAAEASATAVTPGRSVGGGTVAIGIQDTMFDSLNECPLTSLIDCVDQNINSDTLTIPGGFGWLKFGLGPKCNWTYSLGMEDDGGCQVSKPFLDSQFGPPADSHGCCHEVGRPGSEDKIGSLTGNEWGDISFYVDNKIPVWVPIWDYSGGEGSNGWYHVVGFGAIMLTGGDEHARELEGAAIDVPCELPGHDYCAAPGGAFTIEATGGVRLVR